MNGSLIIMIMQSVTKKILIIGAKGMLGNDLVNFFSSRYTVCAVDKDNYNDHIGETFDILINANGNSRRFWANQNPQQDYDASVFSVEKTLNDFKFDKYIFISSSDVYNFHGDPIKNFEDIRIEEEKLEPYGLHKYQAENLVKTLPSYLILRCSAMLGTHLTKGVVRDILDKKDLFVTTDSFIQFITTSAVAEVIHGLLNAGINNDMFNCGGRGSVVVKNIMELAGYESSILPEAKKQEYEMNVDKLSRIYNLNESQEYLVNYLTNIN